MPAELGRITVFCFAASYAVALLLELLRQFWAKPSLRWPALVFATAGVVAHTAFVAVNPLPLQTSFGSLTFLAWILALFGVYGSLHHRGLVWSLFVLPLVLGLILLAQVFPSGSPSPGSAGPTDLEWWQGKHFWPVLHGTLMLLAAVGVSVGFVASVMYLVQARRLKTKQLPGKGLKLWSLERLELMNQRAIVLAFPLLTIGLLIAAFQMVQLPDGGDGLENVKVISTIALWVVFLILLYLRYGVHARGKQLAMLTILAFALMLFALVSVHPFGGGGTP